MGKKSVGSVRCNHRFINGLGKRPPPGLKHAGRHGEGGIASLAETLQRFEQRFGPDRVWRELWPVQGVARREPRVRKPEPFFFFVPRAVARHPQLVDSTRSIFEEGRNPWPAASFLETRGLRPL